MKKDSNIEFKGTVVNCRYNSESFKIYVIDVNREVYPNLQTNRNNEVVIVGNIPSLVPNVEYEIKAISETNKNFGIQYKVKNIKRDRPTNSNSSRVFLLEILTGNQADTLLAAYPNIIDKIIKNDIEDIDFSLLKGIKEKTFNNIKQKVIENFCLIELIDKFGGLIDMSVIKKLYDTYTNPTIIERELRRDPYRCLCQLSRIGFKTADGILLNIEKCNKENPTQYKFKFDNELKYSVDRMRSCLNYILEENESSGNTKMDLKEAREKCGKLVPECIDMFVKVIKENNDLFHVDLPNKLISIKTTHQTEVKIANFIKSMLENPIVWNVNTELYREVDNMSMTDEQLSTIEMMCNNNIGILTAPGGSGKSASVKALLNMLESNKKSYMLMTPTGASSKVLEDYSKRECGTIHRQLDFNPGREKYQWGYNEKNKLDKDFVIVDEFSMVDIFLFNNLINAIDTKRTKLLLVFDPYQLPSVACGNVAQDLLSSKIVPTVYLSKIFRYAEGGLMKVVTNIRNSEKFLPSDFKGNYVFGTNKDFIYSEVYQDKIPNQVLNIYSKLIKDGYELQDIMVLSSQNKGDYGTKAINLAIQKLMQKGKKNNFVMRGDSKFFKGDKVIQTINNYKAKDIYDKEVGVFNGNTGVVVDVKYNVLEVEFDGRIIVYEKEDLNQLELGYCISIHKSQGSAAKQVIVISPRAHTFMLNSNLLYVAGTRAKERVYLLGNISTINSSIKKKENLSRNTWLEDLLSKL